MAGEDRRPLGCTINSGYPKTLPAILKIVQAVFSLIAYLCVACAPWWTLKSQTGHRYFEWVCMWHMWSVIILYLIVLLNVHHKLNCIDWHLTEFIHYVLASIFYFTGSVTTAVFALNASLVAGAIMGFICTLLYIAGAYFAFKLWKTLGPDPVQV